MNYYFWDQACASRAIHNIAASGQRFGTVYADPPWKDIFKRANVGELAALPVERIVLPDAHLHIWCDDQSIAPALSVIKAWGFVYKSIFTVIYPTPKRVWLDKVTGGTTDSEPEHYWQQAHDLLLLGVRGQKCKHFLTHHRKSWVHGSLDISQHRPQQMRKVIQEVSPGPHLKLFAREGVYQVWEAPVSATPAKPEPTLFDAIA